VPSVSDIQSIVEYMWNFWNLCNLNLKYAHKNKILEKIVFSMIVLLLWFQSLVIIIVIIYTVDNWYYEFIYFRYSNNLSLQYISDKILIIPSIISLLLLYRLRRIRYKRIKIFSLSNIVLINYTAVRHYLSYCLH